MATKQKARERKFSPVADAATAAPRLVAIYQNHAASISDATAPVRMVLDNDYTIRGMSLSADVIATSVKATINVGGVAKLTGTVTVADKAVYFSARTPIIVPAGVEVTCDIDVTGTCGGIAVFLDTIP